MTKKFKAGDLVVVQKCNHSWARCSWNGDYISRDINAADLPSFVEGEMLIVLDIVLSDTYIHFLKVLSSLGVTYINARAVLAA